MCNKSAFYHIYKKFSEFKMLETMINYEWYLREF